MRGANPGAPGQYATPLDDVGSLTVHIRYAGTGPPNMEEIAAKWNERQWPRDSDKSREMFGQAFHPRINTVGSGLDRRFPPHICTADDLREGLVEGSTIVVMGFQSCIVQIDAQRNVHKIGF